MQLRFAPAHRDGVFGTMISLPTEHSRLWCNGSCELVFDGLFEDCFRLGPAHKHSINEKSGRSAYPNPHAFLIILLNLSLEFLGRNTCIKLLCVQLQLRRFGNQTVSVQASL